MGLKKFSFKFNPDNKGLHKILGHLESDIMEIIWAGGEMTVRQVYEKLRLKRKIAYTTVMTVMSRLADKGLLRKMKEGASFVYRATSSREEFTRLTVKKVIRELLDDFAAPAISQFLEFIEGEKIENIEELSKLIKLKQKNRK